MAGGPSLAGLPTLLHAVLPAVPVINRVPGIRRTARILPDRVWRRRAVVERDQVSAYADVCGFEHRDTVPLTYPHVLAFPLHLQLLTDPAFPYPAVGTVHVANSITRLRPVGVGEELRLTARVGRLRTHPRGRTFEVTVHASTAEAPVWESVSTYLRPGVGLPDDGAQPGSAAADPQTPTAAGIPWRLPADLGRRYAAVSGDRNPIHLYPLTARAFGFRRQIAHGMWSLARCVAALDNRLPDAVTVEAGFRRPIFLPGTVVFAAQPQADGISFSLTEPDAGAPHVLGRSVAA